MKMASKWRHARFSRDFVAVARAALFECGGDARAAGALLYRLARKSEEYYSVAERARLALGVLEWPNARVTAAAALENAQEVTERRARSGQMQS